MSGVGQISRACVTDHPGQSLDRFAEVFSTRVTVAQLAQATAVPGAQLCAPAHRAGVNI
jgi:hypothetical protein